MMAGRIMAEKYGGNTMKELGRVVREIWAEDDAMTIQVLEETEQVFSFDVTRCRYAESNCSQEEPPLDEISPDHYAACYLVDKLELTGITE